MDYVSSQLFINLKENCVIKDLIFNVFFKTQSNIDVFLNIYQNMLFNLNGLINLFYHLDITDIIYF